MSRHRKGFHKATNQQLDLGYLNRRANACIAKGFAKQKWIEFCETMITKGYRVSLYEARQTFSKYIDVSRDGKSFKVRFSNHPPIKAREMKGDCDFFVGRNHLDTTTTGDAIFAVEKFFKNVPKLAAAKKEPFQLNESQANKTVREDLPW